MIRRYRILALVLPPALLLAAAVFLLSERGVNGVVRPGIERLLSGRLGGEVRLGRLELGKGRLTVDGIALRKEGRWRIDVPRMEADFTLRALLGRRLDRLRLEGFRGEFAGGGEGGMPESPPIEIARLEIAGGDLGLRAGGRVWRLRDLALEGTLEPDSPFRLSARLGEDGGVPVALAGRFAWGRIPALALSSARWGGKELLARPLTVTLPEGGGTAGGTLAFDRFDDRELGRIFAVLGMEGPLPAGVRFALDAPRLSFRWGEEELALDLRAEKGIVGKEDRGIPFSALRAKGSRRGKGWSGEGDFLLAGTAPVRVEGGFEEGRGKARIALNASDPGTLLRQLARMEAPPVSGGIDLEAELSAAPGDLLVTARLRGTSGRKGKALPDLSSLSADLSARRRGEEWSGTLRLQQRGREILRGEGTPDRIRVELLPAAGRDLALLLPAGKGTPELLSAEGLGATAEIVRSGEGWRGTGELRADRLSAAEKVAATVEIAGAGERWGGRARLRAARLASGKGALEEVRLEGRLSRSGARWGLREGRFSARLSGEGLPAARLGASGEGELEGRDFRFRFERFSAEGGEYLSSDGTAGLTGGRLAGRGTVAGRLGGKIRLDLSGALDIGEALKGAFYADLKGLPADLALKGTFDPGAKRLEAEVLRVKVPGIGTAGLHGSIAPGRAELAGAVDHPDLREALGRLRSSVGEALPALREMTIAGELRSEIGFLLDSTGWRLRGRALPRGLDLVWPGKKLGVAGVSGEIPFDLGPAASGGERTGRISLSRLALGPAELAGDSLRLRSAPNRFALDTLVFRLAGGELEIAEPAADLAGRELAASVAVRGADLRELSRALGLPEMAGGLSADFGRIRFGKGTLTTGGEMVIDVFGGRIRVRNLRLESLLTPYPTYSADAEFAGIDLQQLTRTLAFGEINGIADGYVRELRLFGKVPSRFEALLETRSKGRRNISVKALRNLTTISQGGIGAVLSRGVYRFIDFYRYRRIGFYCSLKNDVFILRGTARDESGRYLVDGGLLPPKINIIAPEHAISFKEMIKRLQRMERTETKADRAEN